MEKIENLKDLANYLRENISDNDLFTKEDVEAVLMIISKMDLKAAMLILMQIYFAY